MATNDLVKILLSAITDEWRNTARDIFNHDPGNRSQRICKNINQLADIIETIQEHPHNKSVKTHVKELKELASSLLQNAPSSIDGQTAACFLIRVANKALDIAEQAVLG